MNPQYVKFWQINRCRLEATPPSGLFKLHVMTKWWRPWKPSYFLIEPTDRDIYHVIKWDKGAWEPLLQDLTEATSFEAVIAVVRRYQKD
jgi:hypothetical protein